MIEQIFAFFTLDIIYLWLNFGVLPFWFTLIFFPQSKICKIFVTSIFPLLILTTINMYLIFEIYKTGYNLLNNFTLYLGFDELKDLFLDKNFIIIFWIHFLAINLFCGSWIVSDSRSLNASKFLIFFPLLVTYFVGPLGVVIYWIMRIFLAKRISLYD
tara:strand:+ start:112 stop:585 length:474 start_codon:yes stop_codon:yes gene_type:complete